MRFHARAPAIQGLCGIWLILSSQTLTAANWLFLQGTEPPGAPRARLWGFVQPEIQHTDGTKLKKGPWADQDAAFNQQRPDLDHESEFNIIRARLGLRGTGLAPDAGMNFFLLLEAGDNGITHNEGGALKFTDASLTFNRIKGARVRVGQFKYPAGEEGLQAIHAFDYINFTSVTNQLMLERFLDSDGSVSFRFDSNRPNGAVNAFRDIGVQVFDAFFREGWEHSYALMVGNGNGIGRGDNDDDKDVYLYWSSEKVYGGKGPRREGWKLYAWYLDGKRELLAGPGQEQQSFDRTRYGIGSTYRKGRLRGGFEFIKADGMIFNGTDGGAIPGKRDNAGIQVATLNMLPEDEAHGWYLDLGYRVLPKLELDIRYDKLNRGTETGAGEREFETVTLGAQYLFHKHARLLVNYEFRDGEAPELPDNAVPNDILESIDDRFAVQLLVVF